MENNLIMLLAIDEEIETLFVQTYVFKTFLKEEYIKISSDDGAVILYGNVFHQAHKAIAQDTAKALPGVKSVRNRIEIKSDKAPVNSDTWIGIKVKLALLYHRSVSGFGTEVSVKNGIVTLKGEAGSLAQKELTAEFAKDIDGVRSVNNQISIAKIQKEDDRSLNQIVDDASITAQIKGILLIHRSTSMLEIDVETKEGKVALTGKAMNQAEKDMVTKLVGDVHGVTKLNNKMTVTQR